MTEHLFVNFEDAVLLTNQLLDFYNSGRARDIFQDLGDRFNIIPIENPVFHIDQINKNCPECSGCHSNGCILGCFKHGFGQASVLCYWDKALDSILGSKLIIHEVAHVIFEQGFTTNLNSKEAFDLSEEFAMYVENHFNIDMELINDIPTITNLQVTDDIFGGIGRGFGFGIGLALLIGATLLVFKINPLQLKGKKQR